jgi:ADP-ribose pyrophosphatase YjhB (NUDIX family)
MKNLLENQRFAERYEQLKKVRLNPRRHTRPNAHAHSEEVAEIAGKLAAQNGCSSEEISLLENLGRAHDIGKVMGTARPEKSLEVLAECGPLPESFLALVKWHDTSLPWWKSAQREQAPSDKAWRRLAREVDMRLLCMFMVADRADAPPGWRRNAPTVWLLAEAGKRGLVEPLLLDVEGHPSEVSAGALLIRGECEKEALVIRVRSKHYELPKGGIEWDELPGKAAIRELREEAGVEGDFRIESQAGEVDYPIENRKADGGSHLKRVRYFRVEAPSISEGALPDRTRERLWIKESQLGDLPLVNEDLRPLLAAALETP